MTAAPDEDGLRVRAAANLAAMREASSHPWASRLACAIHGHERVSRLTEQERRVLSAASFGLTEAMTADTLGIEPQTVKTHLANIQAKLAAKNRTHAVALAIRSGAIQ